MTRKPVPQALYPIRAVAKLTGLPLDTLRAWERRYSAITPERDERGRLYSERDVARLRLLRDVVAAGHAIGRVARMPDAELRQLADGAARTPPPQPSDHVTIDRTRLADALARFDLSGIDRELTRFAAVLRPSELVTDVLMPALAEVGEAWHRGRARIAHEHLISATIRNVLGSFLRMYPRRDGGPRLVFSTPSGERHEIGTLGAAMLAASGGLDVVYLGPDLPAIEIAESAALASAAVVVLGITVAPRGARLQQQIKELARILSPETELWLGGPRARGVAAGTRALVLDGYAALGQQLVRIGARL